MTPNPRTPKRSAGSSGTVTIKGIVHNKDYIQLKIQTDPCSVEKALKILYAYQTAEERTAGATNELNGQGFNGTDAPLLSSFAEQVLQGRSLSHKQLALARKKLPKYWKQILGYLQRQYAQEKTV